jgi:hypothetical protein
LAALFLTYYIIPKQDHKSVIPAFVTGYVIRFAAILVMHQLSPSGLLLLDDIGYDAQGRFLASPLSFQAIRSATVDLGTLHTGYPIVVALVYGLVGPSILSAKLLNAVFGGLCAPVAYLLTAEFSENRSARITATWIACFFLYDVGWSGYLLKDTILLLLFSALVVIAVRFARTRSITLLVLALSFLYAISYFRIYATATLLAAVVFAAAIQLGRKTGRSRISRIISITVALVAVALLASVLFASYSNTIGFLAWYSTTIDQFDSNGVTPLHFALVPSFFSQVLRSCIVYLLGPFAWVFSHIAVTQAVFYPGMYLIYFLLPFFFLGFWKLFSQHRWASTFVLLCYLLHAAVEIYVFQAGERQRMMTDVIFIVCAAMGWGLRKEHFRFIVCIYLLLAFVALVQTAASF